QPRGSRHRLPLRVQRRRALARAESDRDAVAQRRGGRLRCRRQRHADRAHVWDHVPLPHRRRPTGAGPRTELHGWGGAHVRPRPALPPPTTAVALAPRRVTRLTITVRRRHVVAHWRATRSGTTVLTLDRLKRGQSTRASRGLRHRDRAGQNTATFSRTLAAGH